MWMRPSITLRQSARVKSFNYTPTPKRRKITLAYETVVVTIPDIGILTTINSSGVSTLNKIVGDDETGKLFPPIQWDGVLTLVKDNSDTIKITPKNPKVFTLVFDMSNIINTVQMYRNDEKSNVTSSGGRRTFPDSMRKRSCKYHFR
jgi:hypothetical protein